MVASQRKNQTVIEATGFAHQERREQVLGNAQVTEQQVSAEMHAYGNISEALALDATAGLDYVWWDSLLSTRCGERRGQGVPRRRQPAAGGLAFYPVQCYRPKKL